MKNSFIILVVIGILLFGACNNSNEKASAASDTATIKAPDSTATVDAVEVRPAFPTDLTADETKDDSVFADGSEPTSWDNAGIDDPLAFKQFVKKLQIWVATGVKDSVANAIAFPMANPFVKDKEAFLARYYTYMNDSVRAALKNQNLRQIFRNANGVMIGNGRIWLGQVPGGYAITALNIK
jgi:hypothetical protein